MSDQIIFNDIFENSIKETNGDDWQKLALNIQKDNRRLKQQLEDANQSLVEIEHALDLGPDNDWARHAIKRYKDKISNEY